MMFESTLTYLHVVSIGWWCDGKHVAVFPTEAEARAFADTHECNACLPLGRGECDGYHYTGTVAAEDVKPGFLAAAKL